jgi:hypothetical protein
MFYIGLVGYFLFKVLNRRARTAREQVRLPNRSPAQPCPADRGRQQQQGVGMSWEGVQQQQWRWQEQHQRHL